MTRARERRSEEVIVGLFRRGAKERDVVDTSADVAQDEEPAVAPPPPPRRPPPRLVFYLAYQRI